MIGGIKVRHPGNQSGSSLAILAVALLLLVAQSILFLEQGNRLLDDESRQDKANLILLRMREVLADLQDAETGQRGYLLTGTDSYLEPYHRATADIARHMSMARTLLIDNAGRTSQLNLLQSLIDKKLTELDETISYRQARQFDKAINRVKDNSGKMYMDQARTVLAGLMDGIRSERNDLNHEVKLRLRVAEYILVSIAFTITVMVCLAASQLYRLLRQNDDLVKRLQNESTHDVLTGLPNRRMLYAWLKPALHLATRKNSQIAVLFIDLDGFKGVNDIHGHEAGDAVLRAVAERFGKVLRSADMLARLGGDEFAVVASENLSQENLKVLSNRLLASLQEPLLPVLSANAVGASIGIAVYPDNADSLDELLHVADRAMYEAKRAGKGRFCFAADNF